MFGAYVCVNVNVRQPVAAAMRVPDRCHSTAEQSAQYRWHLTISAAPAGFQRDGHAYSLEDAKAGIEAAWQTWIEAAGLTELHNDNSNADATDVS